MNSSFTDIITKIIADPYIYECLAEDYYYYPRNVTRSTLSAIAAYRSSLTLDWLAAEDSRQKELAAAFETEATPVKAVRTDCIGYPRPAAGKIGRLMLELLKNLEGDDGTLILELIQILIRTKLLVDTSMLDSEPDLESLVKTPGVMIGEPHTTFPRILSIIWMLVNDPTTTKKFGWCPIKKVNKYLMMSKTSEIAKQMRDLDIVVARARFIMEEFIQSITLVNMYQKKTTKKSKTTHKGATKKHAMKPRAQEKVDFPQLGFTKTTLSTMRDLGAQLLDSKHIPVSNYTPNQHMKITLFILMFHL